MAINHLESIKMRVYVLLLTCLFFSLLGKPQQPRMMYEDTSRRGVPFSKTAFFSGVISPTFDQLTKSLLDAMPMLAPEPDTSNLGGSV